MDFSSPIRSRAPHEGNFQISLYTVPFGLVVLYVCLFSGLNAFGLVGPDEPRYAAIAQAMAKTHDWITPRLWGAPWFEKPVLYYWTAGISMRIFGYTASAARLPSALAALLAVVAIKWTALRSYGVRTSRYAVLILPASVAMIGFSRGAGPDMLFSSLLIAAMAVACEMLQAPQPGPILRCAFGFFLGAAVLAKGPAAIIIAGGATLLWAALSRQWHAIIRFLHPLIILVFLITALPWYVLCAVRNPDFLRVFIWQHNFQRYLTPIFEHRQPFWFYVPILCVATMPWIFLLPCVFYRKLNDDKSSNESWRASPGLFVLCWAIFPFLFFSFSQSKLPGYIMPAIPPLFLLMSRALDRLFATSKTNSAILVGLIGAMISVLMFSLEVPLRRVGHAFNVPASRMITLIVITIVGGLIAVGLSLCKRPEAGLFTLVSLVIIMVLFMNQAILRIADSHFSARSAAHDAVRVNPSGQNFAISGLKRDWQYGLNYYFERELPEWTPGMPLPEWLFTTEAKAIELRRLGDRVHEVSRVGAPFVVLIHVSQNRIQP